MQDQELAPIVLVVEDEALIRLFIRGALEDGGYAAAEAQLPMKRSTSCKTTAMRQLLPISKCRAR